VFQFSFYCCYPGIEKSSTQVKYDKDYCFLREFRKLHAREYMTSAEACGILSFSFFTPFSCHHNQQPLSISENHSLQAVFKKITRGEEKTQKLIGSKQHGRQGVQ
jgi:hypothetical protein